MIVAKGSGSSADKEAVHFYYDAQSKPIMMRVGIEEESAKYYTFVTNLQGDILGLLDRNQDLVVEYRYDPWGKLVDTICEAEHESLAKMNPFRYRGYVYDEEAALYYLRTRYYNPEWLRFVSEDSLVGKVGKLLTHTVYTYCKNSPTRYVDSDGTDETLIVLLNGINNPTDEVPQNIIDIEAVFQRNNVHTYAIPLFGPSQAEGIGGGFWAVLFDGGMGASDISLSVYRDIQNHISNHPELKNADVYVVAHSGGTQVAVSAMNMAHLDKEVLGSKDAQPIKGVFGLGGPMINIPPAVRDRVHLSYGKDDWARLINLPAKRSKWFPKVDHHNYFTPPHIHKVVSWVMSTIRPNFVGPFVP